LSDQINVQIAVTIHQVRVRVVFVKMRLVCRNIL